MPQCSIVSRGAHSRKARTHLVDISPTPMCWRPDKRFQRTTQAKSEHSGPGLGPLALRQATCGVSPAPPGGSLRPYLARSRSRRAPSNSNGSICPIGGDSCSRVEQIRVGFSQVDHSDSGLPCASNRCPRPDLPHGASCSRRQGARLRPSRCLLSPSSSSQPLEAMVARSGGAHWKPAFVRRATASELGKR
jgi:hypothetical protein